MEEEEEEAEEEEEEQEEDRVQGQLSRASSDAVLLSDPRGVPEGLVNPAFSQDNSQPQPCFKPSSQWGRPVRTARWACLATERPYGFCRSLSSSVENMAFSGAPLSPKRGSFPSLNEAITKESLSGGRGFRDDTSLQSSRSRGADVVCNSHKVW